MRQQNDSFVRSETRAEPVALGAEPKTPWRGGRIFTFTVKQRFWDLVVRKTDRIIRVPTLYAVGYLFASYSRSRYCDCALRVHYNNWLTPSTSSVFCLQSLSNRDHRESAFNTFSALPGIRWRRRRYRARTTNSSWQSQSCLRVPDPCWALSRRIINYLWSYPDDLKK